MFVWHIYIWPWPILKIEVKVIRNSTAQKFEDWVISLYVIVYAAPSCQFSTCLSVPIASIRAEIATKMGKTCRYKIVLDTDSIKYYGHARVDPVITHCTVPEPWHHQPNHIIVSLLFILSRFLVHRVTLYNNNLVDGLHVFYDTDISVTSNWRIKSYFRT